MLITRIWRSQPGRYFCISTKSAGGAWKDWFFARNQLRDVAGFIEDHRDKDLYFCPHGFKRPRRLKPDAELPSLLWADLDEVDPREIDPRPTIAIESSPGRFVGIWLVDSTMSENINRRLTYMLGSDKGGWDLTQVLRIPGTTNYKYESLPRTRIMWSDGPEWKLRDIQRRLPREMEDEEVDAGDVFRKWEKKMPHWLRRELISGKPTAGKRSDMVWKIGNTLIELGVSRDDAFILVKSSPWNKFRGRHNEDRQLRRELDKAVDKHLTARRPVAESDEYTWLAHSLEDVEEEHIEWVWYPYLARGELSILEGDPGLGKSYLAQIVSGALCDGRKLPSVKKGPVIQGKVVYFDIENSAGTVTKKRMRLNGVEGLSSFIQEEGIFSIDDEERLDQIYEALERVKPTLVVFDTINTYLGKADAFKGHEAQQAFVRFREIAKRFNCSVLVLRHLTKSSKERALYRGQGSIAFAGLARVVMTVGLMPEDDETRVMAVTKINVTRLPKALTFTIEELPDTLQEQDRSRFVWGEFVDLTADDIVTVVPKGNGERGEAEEFLRSCLDDGEVEFRKIERMAEARSISIRTLQRASDDLGIIKKSRGFGKEKTSYWSLPDTAPHRSNGEDRASGRRESRR